MKTRTKRIIYIVGGVAAMSGVMAYGAHRYHHDPEHRAQWMVEKVSKKLELSTEQQSKLKGVRDVLMNTAKSFGNERTNVHQEVMDAIQETKLDRQKALAIVTKRTDSVREQAPSIVAAIGDFYDSLTPEQRAKVREKIEDHKPHSHRHW
ncbi:Spy/CpxP family protein refolding chaperone [Pseudomonadota bacterium]